MRTRKWDNVKGMATVDFDPANPLRVDLPGVPETGSLEIPFTSSGYDTPASYHSPAEFEDYREPRGVATVYFAKGNYRHLHLDLTPEQTADIFEAYAEEIDAAELG